MVMEARRLGAVACALVALAITCGTASAETMFLEPAGRIEAISNGSVTFEAEGANVSCPVALTGSLRESFTMRAGTPAGSVRWATAGECSGGTMGFLGVIAELLYKETLGVLEGILFRFTYIEFLISVPILFSCLYRIDGGGLFGVMREREPPVVGFAMLQTTTIVRTTKLSGLLECPRSIVMNGSFTLRPGQYVHVV